MRVAPISTYELGRQPFGLASPAAWLRRAGASVICLDLSREKLREDAIVAFSRQPSASPGRGARNRKAQRGWLRVDG
jgi:hypothetical protein